MTAIEDDFVLARRVAAEVRVDQALKSLWDRVTFFEVFKHLRQFVTFVEERHDGLVRRKIGRKNLGFRHSEKLVPIRRRILGSLDPQNTRCESSGRWAGNAQVRLALVRVSH